MSIHVLDEKTINKIAAGEVVDRPSSIVKELVENAIDAHSSIITVEIKEGGISFIRVTDNGDGIPESEVSLAFLAHATSKIQDEEDLNSIVSLGFRGEALSSICAVSQVELITKTRSQLTGTRYEIEGGIEKSCEQVGAPDGTTFLIRNLFYNTPARRKFLKAATTEAGYISALMERLSMSHPEISFRFIQNGQQKLQTIGNNKLRDVIYSIYGREITNNLIEIDTEKDGIRIYGYVGKPMICRGNRNFENYYINDRYIKNPMVSKAIEDAYASYIMQHKYPFCALKIEISPAAVDVNVHPSKMEMRFSNGMVVYDMVKDTVTEALTRRELIPQVSFSDSPKGYKETAYKTSTTGRSEAPKPSEPKVQSEAPKVQYEASKPSEPKVQNEAPKVQYEASKPQETKVQYDAPKPQEPEIQSASRPIPERIQTMKSLHETQRQLNEQAIRRAPEAFETKRDSDYRKVIEKELKEQEAVQLSLFEKEDLLQPQNEKDIRIIGQVFDTYWIIEFENNMYIIDQHAAHEKVKYERFMKAYENRKISIQMISPPIVLEMTLAEVECYEKHKDYFVDFGYEIEEFGNNTYVVRGIPSDFTESNPKDLVLEILDSFMDNGFRATPESIQDRIATMSCKAAVKGGNRLSVSEASELIHELMGLENPYNCPHGRPTMITMSKYELEKKFKRIV